MGLFRNHFQLNSARSPVRSRLRPFSSTRSTHPSRILIGRSPWRPSIARDAGGRWSVAASPRPGNVRVKRFGGPVMRPSPTSHATAFLQSVQGESESIHSRTLGLWRMCSWCCRVCSFWFGFDVSVAAIRCRPNTSLPGWPSRWSKRCDTRSAEAAGGASAANVASSMVPN